MKWLYRLLFVALLPFIWFWIIVIWDSELNLSPKWFKKLIEKCDYDDKEERNS